MELDTITDKQEEEDTRKKLMYELGELKRGCLDVQQKIKTQEKKVREKHSYIIEKRELFRKMKIIKKRRKKDRNIDVAFFLLKIIKDDRSNY